MNANELGQYVGYDAETGAMTWLESSGRKKAGSRAGSLHKNGYVVVSVSGKQYLGHRLALALSGIAMPTGSRVDHINGNRADNRLCNLRVVSNSVNLQNRRGAASHSKTGLLGASFHKASGRFRADINVNGKGKSLGYFDSAEEAHKAYMAAKRELHQGHEAAHGIGA